MNGVDGSDVVGHGPYVPQTGVMASCLGDDSSDKNESSNVARLKN